MSKIQLPIYLDHHATTPIDPRVLEAMMPYLTERFGNAASRQHVFGWQAEEAVEWARKQIATLIGARAEEIIFTSGATESDNLALLGMVESYPQEKKHLITCVTEHKAILDSCRYLERRGFKVTYLPVNHSGQLSFDDLEKTIIPHTFLVSIMAANNEIGTLHPLSKIGEITREKGILFHSDAVQAIGRIPIDVEETKIDLISLSAHKLYGPKGVGALYVRSKNPKVKLSPLFHGGGHERGLRSGTLNVAGIVGMGKAYEIAAQEMKQEILRVGALRDRLYQKIKGDLDQVYLNGHATERLCNNLNLSFKSVKADALMMEMKEIALSSGATCVSASKEPSHVLKAIGLTKDQLEGSLRFGLGRFNTEEEIDYVVQRVVSTVRKLREFDKHT